jgi:hypothetical protein
MVLTPDRIQVAAGAKHTLLYVSTSSAPLALPSMPHIFTRCALPRTLPKGLSPSWITYGLPACFDGVHRLSDVPHSAEDLPRFDALFNSHYVSP